MDNSHRQSWVPAAIFLGVLYCLIGVAFALPADHVLAWRRAAWGVIAAAYAAHIAYEHFKLRNAPRTAALHVALAVLKGEKRDWAVQKLTELGVTSFVPLRTERSVIDPGEGKLEKLERAVIEAFSARFDLRPATVDPAVVSLAETLRHDCEVAPPVGAGA